MKEMFKSKGIILFVVFMLGVTYFNSMGIEKMNKENIKQEIIMNR